MQAIKLILCFSLIIFFGANTYAQKDSLNTKHESLISNDPNLSKYQTLDSIIFHLYHVISGDEGVERDWDLFKSLFRENAKLMPIRNNKDGSIKAAYITPEEYVKRSGAWVLENGFIEKEAHRITEQFGQLTHVFSTYVAYQNSEDTEPFMRGINSIQLLHDNERWWILNLSWQAESDDLRLPEKYLPTKN